MITFLVCIAALVAGFFIYGRFVDRFFGSDPSRKTPAETMADGVDYIKLPTWKVFMLVLFTVPLTEHDKIDAMQGVKVIGYITKAELGNYLVGRDGGEVELKAQGWNSLS